MKKLLVLLFILFFSPSVSVAVTTYFAIDDTIDLSDVTGFQINIIDQGFDLTNDANLQTRFQGSTLMIDGVNYSGAVSAIPKIWDIYRVNNPKLGIAGLDNTFGSFPLIPGIVFQIDSTSPLYFDISSLILMKGFGDVIPDAQLLSKTLLNGSLLYTASQVPIPSTLLLLGGGILAILGGGRRKNREGGMANKN